MTPCSVSVIMPVYNARRYVAEAVESVLGQTFTDFEFLITDDGSTDGSLALLKRYAERDSRVRLVSRPNTGYAVALNEMLGTARGEFVARMDADDVSMPDRFALQVAFLKGHPEVVCVGGASEAVNSWGQPLIESQYPTDDGAIQEQLLRGVNAILHPSAMMRRDVAQGLGGYRVEMEPAEDLDMWLRMGERGRLANVTQVVVKYRVHGTSVSSRRAERQRERSKAACDQASARRGVERRYQPVEHRPGESRASKGQFSTKFGWWAFNRNDRRLALFYALQALWWVPWRLEGWRLLACALLKPVRRST